MQQKAIQFLRELEEKREIRFWRLIKRRQHRREFYLMGAEERPILDQDRMVEIESLRAEVWVAHGGQQGFASRNLMAYEDLRSQIFGGVEQARVSQERVWTPPAPLEEHRVSSMQKSSFNGGLKESSQQLYQLLVDSIAKTKGKFNSAELFCSHVEENLWTSKKFERTSSLSSIYAEVCFSAEKGRDSQELLLTQWAARPEDLDFSEMCEESARGAEALLQASSLNAGRYAVLLRGPVLLEVLQDVSAHLDARANYYQMPHKNPGDALIEGYLGADFSLWWNPQREGALSIHGDDGWGRPLKPLELVAGNRVKDVGCSAQMAQYLDRPPATERGCLEVKTPGRPVAELLRGHEVLEILQFSGLFTSATDLTFSSEIRLARLWKSDGSFVYVKGGSLSGSVREHFKKLQFSDRSKIFNRFQEPQVLSYYGPEHALIHDVPVSG